MRRSVQSGPWRDERVSGTSTQQDSWGIPHGECVCVMVSHCSGNSVIQLALAGDVSMEPLVMYHVEYFLLQELWWDRENPDLQHGYVRCGSG